jgi:hypothetical protein
MINQSSYDIFVKILKNAQHCVAVFGALVGLIFCSCSVRTSCTPSHFSVDTGNAKIMLFGLSSRVDIDSLKTDFQLNHVNQERFSRTGAPDLVDDRYECARHCFQSANCGKVVFGFINNILYSIRYIPDNSEVLNLDLKYDNLIVDMNNPNENHSEVTISRDDSGRRYIEAVDTELKSLLRKWIICFA